MNKHILKKQNFFSDLPDNSQIFSDPFMPVSKGETISHENRFYNSENPQNILKNEENKS